MKNEKRTVAFIIKEDEKENADAFAGILNSIPGFHVTDCGAELVITWEESKYRKYARHNGGRKEMTAAKEVPVTPGRSIRELLRLQDEAVYTCGDILFMQIQGMKPEQIAEKTGLSRATYFRRLKKHRDLGDMEPENGMPF